MAALDCTAIRCLRPLNRPLYRPRLCTLDDSDCSVEADDPAPCHHRLHVLLEIVRVDPALGAYSATVLYANHG
jgi:hypothetical protein